MRGLWLLMTAVLLGCSAEREPGELFGPSEEGVLVVDARLLVDQPMPDLFLRRTADPRLTYDGTAVGVTTARVSVRTGDGTVLAYTADPDSAGRYLPPIDAPPVLPHTGYELTVQVGDESLTAQTRTPGRLRVREAVLLDETSLEVRRRFALFDGGGDVYQRAENQVEYLDGLLEVRVDTAASAAGYQLALASLDLDSEFVIDADFLEEDDYEDFDREGASPVVATADGRVRMPWFAIAFAGRHVWHTFAVDRNWYDFARTDPDVGGGAFGELAGDGFRRPLFHVEGGIGLFGSAAVDSVGFVVLPRPAE